MPDLVELLNRTTAATAKVVAAVAPEHLDRPTPCSEWTVRDLLNHMVGTALLFTAAVTGESIAVNPFGTPPDDVIGADPHRAYDDAAARLVGGWRARGLDGTVRLVRGEMPAPGACTVALCDQLGHGWDLAQAIGAPYEVDDEVLDTAFAFMHQNLGPDRRGPGMGFAPAVDAPPGASRVDELMAFMGRSPLTTSA